MERTRAIDSLPEAYAAAIRQIERGADPTTVATDLGVAPEAVGAFVEVARLKLLELLAAEEAVESGDSNG